MSIGEGLAKTPTSREIIEMFLSDETIAATLPKQVGRFTLWREPSREYHYPPEMVSPLVNSPMVLREGFVDIDDDRVRVLGVDLLSVLAANPSVSEKVLSDWLGLFRGKPNIIYFLLNKADGEIEVFSDTDSEVF